MNSHAHRAEQLFNQALDFRPEERARATDNGRPYFVMELVRGIPMTKFCDENSMATKDRLDLFIKVCHAIQHAHQKGIIHRDIKPSNVLVTLHDGVPVPKVIDFGIAKATQGELTDKTIHTQFQQFIGTPAYMSPEQAEMSGLDIDTRGDVYSPGVLLYELLVGKTPFDAQELRASGIDAMRKTIREKEPARPSTKLATLQGEELATTAKRRGSNAPKLIHLLKGDLDWITMKCLEKDRTRRYETANGVAMDVQRFLNSEPVLARPASHLYRFRKLARRNKVCATGNGAISGRLAAATSFGRSAPCRMPCSAWRCFLAASWRPALLATRRGSNLGHRTPPNRPSTSSAFNRGLRITKERPESRCAGARKNSQPNTPLLVTTQLVR
ncbi:MAG TPA: serine/threonine-protein kinase [Candidatus Eisenbacteria bacterium]|nr:serine/threonine-protein kinase [Candidatus Eisenbacteria bacterium]